MAMDATQTKAQQVRLLLLPGLRSLAEERGIGDELNLMCTRFGTLELTITSARGSKMLPLFTSDEIMDDSYKAHFRPRVEKLLSAGR